MHDSSPEIPPIIPPRRQRGFRPAGTLPPARNPLSRTRRNGIFGTLAVLFILAAGWIGSAIQARRPDLERALGFAAQVGCSGVFVSHRSPEAVQAEFPPHPVTALIRLRPWVVPASLRLGSGSESRLAPNPAPLAGVSVSFPFPFARFAARTSVYDAVGGCTLLPVGMRHEGPSLSYEGIGESSPESPVLAVDPGLGLNPALAVNPALERVLDGVFEAEGANRGLVRTRAVVVLVDGVVVAERYAPAITPETRLPGWSMAKSVTHALVGLLLAETGRDPSALNDLFPTRWGPDEDPRREITLEDLLRMRSGLRFVEDYGGLGSDANQMLWGSGNVAAYAASQPLEARPGTVWHYSSGTTNLISAWLQDELAGTGRTLREFAHDALFESSGMSSAVFESDAHGTLVASSLLHATARDWARFGNLYLNEGQVQRGSTWIRILPEGWTHHARQPTPQAPGGDYGAHFWLNAGSQGALAGDLESDRPWPGLPATLYRAGGFQGQIVAIFPDERLVVVRLGADGEGTGWDPEAFLEAVWRAVTPSLVTRVEG